MVLTREQYLTHLEKLILCVGRNDTAESINALNYHDAALRARIDEIERFNRSLADMHSVDLDSCARHCQEAREAQALNKELLEALKALCEAVPKELDERPYETPAIKTLRLTAAYVGAQQAIAKAEANALIK